MSSIVVAGNTSGSVTLAAPDVAGTTTLTLPATSGTVVTSANINTYASSFPAGTAMVFAQTAAPTGWTKSTAHDNKALRLVSGTASSGGSVGFTTAFALKTVTGAIAGTTLDTTQIPSHNHTSQTGPYSSAIGQTNPQTGIGTGSSTRSTNNTGGGGSHSHSFTGTSIDLTVQYVDVIIATKN